MMKIANKLLLRLGISTIISFAFAFLISEGSHLLISDDSGREPEDIILVIPAGTADRVSQGLPVPSIPSDMVFYEGDQLFVKNEDSESHQLGPVWVPPGTTGKLSLEQSRQFFLSCSFQPDNKLGLDVRQRTTNSIRVQGVLAMGLPSSVLLWVFTFVLFPLKAENPGENL